MFIKKLKINDDLKFYLCQIAVIGMFSIPAIAYYSYDNKTQIIETEAPDLDTFVNEEGQICCNFEPGEHKIKISRNDAYYHKINSIDGYNIESVDVNGWRDNNQVVYVNVEPVVAVGTLNKDGIMTFNDFGEVITSNLSLEKSY